MKACRAAAALLAYPSEALIAALPEISVELDGVDGLLEELMNTPLIVLEERYVSLFDRSRALSLHLFEHVHGDSRERGQAMVDLRSMYETRGLDVAGHELPDYVPAFLEYLSLLDPDEARGLLQETSRIWRALGERLAERGSRYAQVFASLLELSGEPGLSKAVAKAQGEESAAALDAQWMDPAVTFGPSNEPQPIRLYRNGVPA